MRIRSAIVLVLLAASPLIADDVGRQFDLALEEALRRPADPRTQARLARWNDDPMARVWSSRCVCRRVWPRR